MSTKLDIDAPLTPEEQATQKTLLERSSPPPRATGEVKEPSPTFKELEISLRVHKNAEKVNLLGTLVNQLLERINKQDDRIDQQDALIKELREDLQSRGSIQSTPPEKADVHTMDTSSEGGGYTIPPEKADLNNTEVRSPDLDSIEISSEGLNDPIDDPDLQDVFSGIDDAFEDINPTDTPLYVLEGNTEVSIIGAVGSSLHLHCRDDDSYAIVPKKSKFGDYTEYQVGQKIKGNTLNGLDWYRGITLDGTMIHIRSNNYGIMDTNGVTHYVWRKAIVGHHPRTGPCSVRLNPLEVRTISSIRIDPKPEKRAKR